MKKAMFIFLLFAGVVYGQPRKISDQSFFDTQDTLPRKSIFSGTSYQNAAFFFAPTNKVIVRLNPGSDTLEISNDAPIRFIKIGDRVFRIDRQVELIPVRPRRPWDFEPNNERDDKLFEFKRF